MVYDAKRNYLQAIKKRYTAASKAEKSKILDEFCAVCNYNRKYAIRVINKENTPPKKKPGPKSVCQDEALLVPLKRIWFAADQPCSLKLKANIPIWIDSYEAHFNALEPLIREKLLTITISKSTIDRVLKPVRAKSKRKGLSGTKSGSMLKNQIPIQFTHWDVKKPGFLEADTVAHCGDTIAGQFAWSLTVTDVCTTWTEIRALRNKKSGEVDKQITMI